MPLATEAELKRRAHERLPDYYAEIVDQCRDTFAYAIYDCEVPAYRKGRICLVGRRRSLRPSTHGSRRAQGDLTMPLPWAKRSQLIAHWRRRSASGTQPRTDTNNDLVRFGNQLGRALVLGNSRLVAHGRSEHGTVVHIDRDRSKPKFSTPTCRAQTTRARDKTRSEALIYRIEKE